MNNYEKLINTLKEVFMLDKADLDFGIYRIMNQKRGQIEKFLEKDLIPQVKKVLSENLSVDKKGLQKELDDAIQQATALGADPTTLPKVIQLNKRISETGDIESLENEVFSLLANFFKRYFDDGDFISMRRYKKDVYAIPYEGEEVKLHWANADQYYIKTSEYFKNYRFKISGNKTVSFELVEAETEHNNNKIQGDKERLFAIYKDKPIEVVDNELKIFFTYEAIDKKQKQDDLLANSFDTIKSKIPNTFFEVFEKKPTEKDKDRTLLQKHMKDYVVRNTFDYFIHKDLNAFLTRELDFYIKNEVLFIDDINTRDEQAFLSQLSKIKAIKQIGVKVITFLAQLEDFQKKLWLKKKFVVDTQYCITLDRVPQELYEEIRTNQAQSDAWIKLFSIDEIKPQKTNEIFATEFTSFSKPLTINFLQENQFLLLDTAFFGEDFKWKLLASFENFDEQCDGVLINSENYQALTLIQSRYIGQAESIYIDPPYNTNASEILYKNSFKHSSWMSLIENRLSISKTFLKNDGIISLTIDDFEKDKVRLLMDSIFNKDNFLGTMVIRNNPSGRSTVQGVSIAHEYALFYGNSSDSKVGRMDRNEKQLSRYDEKDGKGVFEWVNFRKHGGKREEASTMFYPFFVSTRGYRIPEIIWNDNSETYEVLENPLDDEKVLYPIDENGIERRWKWGLDRTKNNPSEFSVQTDRTGELGIYLKARMNEDGVLPLTWWDKKEYSATAYGTNFLKNMFNRVDIFSYPKSIYAVEDCLISTNLGGDGLVIDYFGGSGTTAHATINLNRKDSGNRKWLLVEMGEYFNTATKPRIQKAIYSNEWKDGKPIGREGISHCFKYMRLESYEDTLNNLTLKSNDTQQLALKDNPSFKEGYMLNYMLDVETKDSLLNLTWFEDPFNCYLNITKNNEMQPSKVDLIETFNYLIGLVVEHSYVAKGYKVVIGKTLDEEKILIVWRNVKEHSNKALNDFLSISSYKPLDNEFSRIYVNGDNNVENLKTGDEMWKVVLIEEEFKKRMFE